MQLNVFQLFFRNDSCGEILFCTEIFGVHFSLKLRNKNSFVFLFIEFFRIYVSKPRMIEEFFNSKLCAKSFVSLFVKKFADQILNFIRIVNFVLCFIRKNDFRLLNFEEHHISWFVVKGSDSYQHFIYQNSQGPPIYRFTVTFTCHHFRSNIFWCATKWSCSLVICNNFC